MLRDHNLKDLVLPDFLHERCCEAHSEWLAVHVVDEAIRGRKLGGPALTHQGGDIRVRQPPETDLREGRGVSD
jgi:hypothetical protein